MKLLLLSLGGFVAAIFGFLAIPLTAGNEFLRDSGLAVLAGGAAAIALSVWAVFESWRKPPAENTRVRPASVRLAVLLLAALAITTGVFQWVYVLHLSYQVPPAEAAAPLGTPLPELELLDDRGQPLALADRQGRGLLIDFYRGHW